MDYLHIGMAPALTVRYAQEAAGCLTATQLLLGLWCVVSTLEWAANLAMFRADGLLTWRILSLRPGLILQSERLRSLFWDRSIVWVLSIRLAAAVIVMVAPASRWIDAAQGFRGAMAAMIAMIATSWFLTNRTWIAADGSDQIGQISTVGALLLASGLAFNQLGLAFAGNLLIAGQLIIAYFFGGLWKLLSSDWRHGLALPASWARIATDTLPRRVRWLDVQRCRSTWGGS